MAVPETKRSRVILILMISSFITVTIASQSQSLHENISGVYKYETEKHILKLRSDGVTIKIRDNQKFKYKSNSGIFPNKKDKGKWSVNGDTLILRFSDGTINKLHILDDKLCGLKDPNSSKTYCLDKK